MKKKAYEAEAMEQLRSALGIGTEREGPSDYHAVKAAAVFIEKITASIAPYGPWTPCKKCKNFIRAGFKCVVCGFDPFETDETTETVVE